MSKQHDRVTGKLAEQGMAWAVRSDKYCGANDSLEDQIQGRKTYHIHPDAARPYQGEVMQFSSLARLESYLKAREAANAAESDEAGWDIMQDWHAGH